MLLSVLSHVGGVAVSLIEFHVGEEAFCTSLAKLEPETLPILEESLLAPCSPLQNSVDGTHEMS